MMRLFYRRYLPSVLMLPFVMVTSATGAKEPVKSTIGQRINAIVAQAGDLSESDEGLWDNKHHKEMIEHPAQYRSDIEAFLSANRDIPKDKVRVAVLALQCLPIDEYLSFVTKIIDLPSGTTGEWALFYSIIPGEEWSTRFQVGYQDSRVRAALEKAARSPNATKKLQWIIKHILDGTYAANIARSKDVPLLKCQTDTAKPRAR